MSPRLELFLVLAHETGHRAASIRQLCWSDVDLDRQTVRWGAENDRIHFEHTTLLAEEAVTTLAQARSRRPAIGDAWVLPCYQQPGELTQREALPKRKQLRAGGLP